MPKVLAPARQEILTAVAYYEGEEPGLGTRFRNLVAKAFGQIDELPLACPPYQAPGAPDGVRHVRLFPFQESVVFVVVDEPIVIAVAHAKRRPAYWAGRLK